MLAAMLSLHEVTLFHARLLHLCNVLFLGQLFVLQDPVLLIKRF